MSTLEEEMKKRGLMPQTEDPLLAEMQRRGLSVDQPKPMNMDDARSQGFNMVKDFFQGNMRS